MLQLCAESLMLPSSFFLNPRTNLKRTEQFLTQISQKVNETKLLGLFLLQVLNCSSKFLALNCQTELPSEFGQNISSKSVCHCVCQVSAISYPLIIIHATLKASVSYSFHVFPHPQEQFLQGCSGLERNHQKSELSFSCSSGRQSLDPSNSFRSSPHAQRGPNTMPATWSALKVHF